MTVDEFAAAVKLSEKKRDDAIERAFTNWWNSDGRFIDPDTSDVDWFDKRKELAGIAFMAAFKLAVSQTRWKKLK